MELGFAPRVRMPGQRQMSRCAVRTTRGGSTVSSTKRTKFAVGFVGLCVGATVWCAFAAAQDRKAPDIVVTLLGTGSPIPEPGRLVTVPARDRANAMTLVQAGPEVLLFDAGRGVVERLAQAGVNGRDITSVFLTHFHSDHIVGLPDLWLTSRLTLAWGNRTKPLEVIGPLGTEDLIGNLVRAYQPDVSARPDQPRIDLAGREFDRDGVIFDRNGVRVTAFTVDHGPAKPAVGYRIDYKTRSVLISGDTRLDENVIKYGTGVDLLLHEVLAVNPALLQQIPKLVSIFNLHASPQQCGEVFAKTKPKLAAFTHIVLMGAPAFGVPLPAPTVQDMIDETRKAYDGPLVSGIDLISFEIGETVTVKQPM
jgi:ribonuclease Z